MPRRALASAMALVLLHATVLRAGVLCAQSMAQLPAAASVASPASSGAQHHGTEHHPVDHAAPGDGAGPGAHQPAGHAAPGDDAVAGADVATVVPLTTSSELPAPTGAPAHCALMAACGTTATPAGAVVGVADALPPALQPEARNAVQPASALLAPEPPPPRA